ncbi:MAG: ATP-binding cassette domain-containing protein [Bacteroidetes bacterium]|nr:ATP-binding cassette domain-containing protein [Fibrella sp.]
MIEADLIMPRLFAEGAGDLHLQLAFTPGSLTAIVGPSGAGKTTLLRLLAGLETPYRGRIVVDGTVWLDTRKNINLRPQQRSIGYVFQDTALFPNMTVRENIEFAARPGQAGPNQRPLVDELIDATGLAAFIDQKPSTLSGGQRQRVALARALVRRPALLLLDEPFAALDGQASETLRQTLLRLHQTWGTTTLLVSHFDADVRALADRVVRLVQGKISEDRVVNERTIPLTEPIQRIRYDATTRQWVIETATLQLRSANPAWGHLSVGDPIQLTW